MLKSQDVIKSKKCIFRFSSSFTHYNVNFKPSFPLWNMKENVLKNVHTALYTMQVNDHFKHHKNIHTLLEKRYKSCHISTSNVPKSVHFSTVSVTYVPEGGNERCYIDVSLNVSD